MTDARAPQWVQAVTPNEIVHQRLLGWPDFHPEDFCHQCGQRNLVWWADSELWNAATAGLARGQMEVLCPSCFAAGWEAATGLSVIWELRLDRRSRELDSEQPLVDDETLTIAVESSTQAERRRAIDLFHMARRGDPNTINAIVEALVASRERSS